MRVAFYGRYSSDNQKESSIDDQYRNCERRAEREGWTITARYEDRAISGTTVERPEYQQMLKDAKERKFETLLVDDLSRLSRDEEDVIRTRKRLVFYGVRLIGVSDGIDTSQKGHKIQASFKGIMNEVFIDDLKDKIKRGMEGQALEGFHCSGKSFGYRLVPVYHPTRKDQYEKPEKIGAKLVVDPDQQKWVQWIFEQYADGLSPLKIVAELNRRGIPPPGAHYDRKSGRPRTWCASALHGNVVKGTGLLNNPLYRGLYVWNRSRKEKDPDTGTKKRIFRDEREWIMKEMPELRIIDDTLWEKVKTRRLAVGYAVAALREALHSRARSTGRNPKYLFSGLLACGQCGSNMIIVNASDYGCTRCHNGGATANTCTNSLTVKRSVVESRLLTAIQEKLFTEEGVDIFTQEFERYLIEQRKAKTPDKDQMQARLTEVEREITNLMVAIKAGMFSPTLKQALEDAEAERTRLQHTLQGPVKKLDLLTTVLPNLVERFRRMLDNLARATRHEVDKARGILRGLLVGQIVLHPSSDGTERFLTAELAGDYAGLVRLTMSPKIKYSLDYQNRKGPQSRWTNCDRG